MDTLDQMHTVEHRTCRAIPFGDHQYVACAKRIDCAFELRAVDYVLKPVRAERLAEAVRRVVEGAGQGASGEDEQVPVERGGVTRFLNRSDITYVEAHGDYARLHTADGSHLLRTPLSQLEQDWGPAGFVRIHRSLLASRATRGQVRAAHRAGRLDAAA